MQVKKNTRQAGTQYKNQRSAQSGTTRNSTTTMAFWERGSGRREYGVGAAQQSELDRRMGGS